MGKSEKRVPSLDPKLGRRSARNGVEPWRDVGPDGAQLRPHIVWFGEAVPLIDKPWTMVESADVVIVVGTSLQVYPAAGLVGYAPADAPIHVVDPHTPSREAAGSNCTLHAVEAHTPRIAVARRWSGDGNRQTKCPRLRRCGESAHAHAPGAGRFGGHCGFSCSSAMSRSAAPRISPPRLCRRKGRDGPASPRKVLCHKTRVKVPGTEGLVVHGKVTKRQCRVHPVHFVLVDGAQHSLNGRLARGAVECHSSPTWDRSAC